MAYSYDNYGYCSGDRYTTCPRCGRETRSFDCPYCPTNRQAPTPMPDIDAQIAQAERRVAALLAKQEEMAKFDADYGDDDAILFKRRFKKAGPSYTYVAVKTPVGWYITGQDASRGMTFAKLVEEHLLLADEVWVCTEWRQMC